MVPKVAKVKKLIRIPVGIFDAITAYQKDNGIPTFTASVLELLRKALKADGYL